MVIELHTQEIVKDLRAKSHYDVAQIADVEARYRAEAGTEKRDEVIRCIAEGLSRLQHRCRRFLGESLPVAIDNTVNLPETLLLDLAVSERRAVNKEPLSQAMHVFVVEYALSKFYTDMALQELSNKHSILAVDAGNLIDEMLYSKLPPIV